MANRRLIFLIGIPCVGKSSWIKSNADLYSDNYIIINYDEMVIKAAKKYNITYNDMFKNPKTDKIIDTANKYSRTIYNEHILECIESGKDIFVDMTNMSEKARIKMIKRLGAQEWDKYAIVLKDNDDLDFLENQAKKRDNELISKGELSKTISREVLERMKSNYETPNENIYDRIYFINPWWQ